MNSEERLEKVIKNVLSQPKLTKKELRKRIKEERKEQKSPEVIDAGIEAFESPDATDSLVNWNGVTRSGAEWEAYKIKVGYYERHPERKEKSQSVSKMLDMLQEEF